MPKRPKPRRSPITLRKLSARLSVVEDRVDDLIFRQANHGSVFDVKAVHANGRHILADGSTTCVLCNGVKWQKDVSPKGACLPCLGGEIAALSAGRTMEKSR